MRWALILIVWFLVGVEWAFAQHSLRDWTDDTGTQKTRATLVKINDDKVELRLENGQIQTVPIDQLSQSDVAYIRDKAPITNSIGMKLVRIPKGTFTMGSPEDEVGRYYGETQHEVTISKNYYIGMHEVTQAQYQEVMGENPSHFNDERVKGDGSDHPVERVSWDDAVEFCKRLSELPEERAAGRVYRLPTEAEWEYACRAGKTTKYNFGNNSRQLGDHAWFKDNSDGETPAPGRKKVNTVPRSFLFIFSLETRDRTHAVGQKKANVWGLHDIHGNVYEWCADRFGENPPGAVTDPTGPSEGANRVIRGGSWANTAAHCRSAIRSPFDPTLRMPTLGFRVTLSPSSQIPAETEEAMKQSSGVIDHKE